MKSFIRSVFFLISILFRRKEVDVIFYYPQHFNRGPSAENMFFNHFYTICDNKSINYISLEEPDFSSSIARNDQSKPFDIIYIIILILRKFIKSDYKIGQILGGTILRGLRFKNYIVLSQSMLSIFRGINPEARIFDMQHGVIYSNKSNYIKDGTVSATLQENNVSVLLFGRKFQEILKKNDSSKYFHNHSYIVGSSLGEGTVIHNHANKNILVSLQFTEDHTLEENELIADILEQFIIDNHTYSFFLKDHPRYNDEINLDRFFKLDNVYQADYILEDCFKRCSIHLTVYSTTTFESAIFGIPTIFLDVPISTSNIFRDEFNYPLFDGLDNLLADYGNSGAKVREWVHGYFEEIDECQFISLLA